MRICRPDPKEKKESEKREKAKAKFREKMRRVLGKNKKVFKNKAEKEKFFQQVALEKKERHERFKQRYGHYPYEDVECNKSEVAKTSEKEEVKHKEVKEEVKEEVKDKEAVKEEEVKETKEESSYCLIS